MPGPDVHYLSAVAGKPPATDKPKTAAPARVERVQLRLALSADPIQLEKDLRVVSEALAGAIEAGRRVRNRSDKGAALRRAVKSAFADLNYLLSAQGEGK